MSNEPTTAAKLRGLPWSIGLNAANTVFTQFTFFGAAFVLFLDRLGLSKSDIGFILSLIPFSGLIAPLVAPFTARFGYKRTFLLFFLVRKLMAVPLLLTPWLVAQFGPAAALAFVALVVALFALSRSVEETAYYPWNQEFVPATVRGQYSAMSNIFTALVGVVAVSVAGLVIERSVGLAGFMTLIAVGVLFGLLSVWCGFFIPGGAPVAHSARQAPRDLHVALRDANFLRYLAGLALITLGVTPIASFLPLYLGDQVGLSEGQVVMVQNGALMGALASSYLWGWTTDRYGSRPVMLVGVTLLMVMPLLWWIMPRHAPLSLAVALAIAFGQGLANLGWGIGATKLLFVNVVPEAKKMDYLALWFAWAGITAGLSQLVGGWLLDGARNLSGQWAILPLDPYSPLFVIGVAAPLLSLWLLSPIRDEGRVSVGQFAGIFVRGNPVMAISSLVRYHMAKDEQGAVQTTARLGQANSPLAVEELLEALADPRFNVRFEAILTIGRMKRPHPRLVRALGEILMGNNPSLSVIAAWALGRIGDDDACAPLRQGLDSHYRSIQAHSARSLGVLRDIRIIPRLLKRLRSEPDEGLRIAYASALGNLRASSATPAILSMLAASNEEATRMELALALARIVSQEHRFIQLWRSLRNAGGTAIAQAVTALAKKLRLTPTSRQAVHPALTACAEALARNDFPGGVETLVEALRALPLADRADPAAAILDECSRQLAVYGDARRDYLLLALVALDVIATER